MTDHILDRLLVTLDVSVEAFAICEVRQGVRLVQEPLDAIVVHYVLAGTLHLTASGSDPIACGPGSVVVVPPGLKQALSPDDMPQRDVLASESCAMVRDGILLFDAADGGTGDLRVVCGTIMASISGSFGLVDRVKEPIAGDLSDVAIVRNAFAVMLSEIGEPDLGSRAMTGALMKTCLVVLFRRHLAQGGSEASVLSALRDPRLGKAVTAIIDKPAGHHTVAELAAIAGMSRSVFAREFSRAFAMSPMEFVAKTRLHHAAEMLRSTNLPIKVIAGSIGFASRSHFSRAFRDAYGADPSKFRKTITKPELDAPRNLRGSRERFALDEEPENGA